MSTKIQALPLPQRQARVWMAGPLAIFAILVTTAALVGYFALRHDEPASRPTAAYENSGVVIGTGPGLQSLAGNAAYENSAGITGTGPGLAELAKRFAAYRDSGLVSGTGPGLAELRGIDVIVSSSTSIWPSEAALERRFAGAGFASPSFPSVAAMERALAGSISPASFPSVAAMERALAGSIRPASFPSVAAMERGINASSVSDNCGLVRHGPC
jgi:hypothetical protein